MGHVWLFRFLQVSDDCSDYAKSVLVFFLMLMLFYVFPLLLVMGSIQNGCRGVSSPCNTVSHGGRESEASWGGGTEAGLPPAGGAGELKERRQSPFSATPTPAAPQTAPGVGPQLAGSALQLLTCRGTGNTFHTDTAVAGFCRGTIMAQFHNDVNITSAQVSSSMPWKKPNLALQPGQVWNFAQS